MTTGVIPLYQPLIVLASFFLLLILFNLFKYRSLINLYMYIYKNS